MSYGYVKDNYLALMGEVSHFENKCKRNITVVAVTKSGTDEELFALMEAGAVDIGENRPSELQRRGELLREAGFRPRLHEIGQLQRNKVKLVADIASLIHSVDSLPLAVEIDRRAAKIGRRIPVLIEVNSGREENKGGVMPECAEELFLAMRELPSIELRGVMTMGPASADPEELRPYFKLAREIFENLGGRYGYAGEPILSMGMSDSYRVAIEEGSSLIRVGRNLFRK